MTFSMCAAPQRLADFLSARLPGKPEVRVSGLEPVLGGYSRIMVRFVAEWHRQPHALVLRGDPPEGRAFMETDRCREWTVLEALTRHGKVRLPRALFFDPTGEELGTKAMILESIPSRSLLASLGELNDAARLELGLRACDLAASIHVVPPELLAPHLHTPASWDEYVDQAIEDWRETERRHPEPLPIFRRVARWLEEHRPAATSLAVVHGEFQASNVLHGEDGELYAVDWEMCRIGDPREDLGWLWWMERLSPPSSIGVDLPAACAHYCRRRGLSPDIVTPSALRYFAILPMGRALRGPLRQVAALAGGASQSLAAAYFTTVLPAFHAGWFQDIVAAHEEAAL